MKVDILALGMLTRMRKGFDLLREHKGVALDLATLPPEDPRTYAMIRRAGTPGPFQIESRARRAMPRRLGPRIFHDPVAQVAIAPRDPPRARDGAGPPPSLDALRIQSRDFR